jgi:hypothetical protein
MLIKNKPGDLQVWWVPQVPMHPFCVPVNSVEMGIKIIDVLAGYDEFQFKNKIKPDYCNTGGLQRWCEDGDGNGNPGWEDWFDEDTGEDNPQIWLDEVKQKEEAARVAADIARNKAKNDGSLLAAEIHRAHVREIQEGVI